MFLARTAVAVLMIALVGAACTVEATPPTTATESPALDPVTTTTISVSTTMPTVTATWPPPPVEICESYDGPVVSGTIETSTITEASGIVASRAYPGVVWIHNDSGNGAFVYAATVDGASMGTFELDTAMFDWEDMAIGPGPEPNRDYLYLGDIGDNLRFRSVITVHRIAEPTPDPAGGTVEAVEEFDLRYPDAAVDAEALFVDPLTGDLIVITKPDFDGGVAEIFRAPAAELVDGANVALVPIGGFELEAGVFVTSADIDPTGSLILFRGYNEVWLWVRTDIALTDTFVHEPCATPSTAEVQGEAIAFAATGYSYYTVSEGREPDINYVASRLD